MELSLLRRWLSEECSVGMLTLNGVFECYTLEDKFRGNLPKDKVPGKTCIPEGRYRVLLTESPRFGEVMPLVDAVPGFVGIRIHPGNTARDTEGCILVGRTRGEDHIEQSRAAYTALFQKLKAADEKQLPIWLTIKNAPEVERMLS